MSNRARSNRRSGLSGTMAMKATGMKRIDLWVSPERKAKMVQYCQQNGISQTGLLNRLLANKLADFNSTGDEPRLTH